MINAPLRMIPQNQQKPPTVSAVPEVIAKIYIYYISAIYEG